MSAFNALVPDYEWTPERVAELTKRWASGESGQSIAAAMGITKNMVVGKVRRLDLTLRRAPRQASRALEPIPFDRLTSNTCAWPMWDNPAEGYSFCGAPVGTLSDGRPSPYCDAHSRIAYDRPKKQREDHPLKHNTGALALNRMTVERDQ